jgi:hypothetical protein
MSRSSIFETLFIVFLFSTQGFCKGATDGAKKIEALISAKTTDELDRRLNEIEKVDVLKGACQLQLGRKRLPYACFALPAEGSREKSNDLRRMCLSIAHQTDEIQVVKHGILPADCEKAAMVRVEVNRYKSDRIFDL